MQQDQHRTPTKQFLQRKHKSAKRILNPTILSNKLKINFPLLSVRNDVKDRESYHDRFWTQRGTKCKTEEIQRKSPQEVKKTTRIKKKEINWDTFVDEKMSSEKMNQFLNENPQGKYSPFENQVNQKQSQKIKRQLRNLEQIQTKLFNKIQTVNREQGRQTQIKHPLHTRIISNDLFPLLKAKQKQIIRKKEHNKIINSFDGMVTFSPAGGKQWNRREAYKSEHQIERKMKI